MLYGERGGGVIASVQGLWHSKQYLSVSNCGLNNLNNPAGDKEKRRGGGVLG